MHATTATSTAPPATTNSLSRAIECGSARARFDVFSTTAFSFDLERASVAGASLLTQVRKSSLSVVRGSPVGKRDLGLPYFADSIAGPAAACEPC